MCRPAESEEGKARTDVERYLSAVNKGDVDQIVQYSKDERDPDEDQRKEMLVRYLERNPVKRLEVLSFNFVGEKGSTVTISGQFGEKRRRSRYLW